MVRNPNYLKMIEMGEWLEDLLEPKVENWKVEELLIKVIKLLDLRYTINHDHPFLKWLEQRSVWGTELNNYKPGLLAEWIVEESIIELKNSIRLLANLFKTIHDSSQPWGIVLKKLLNDAPNTKLITKLVEMRREIVEDIIKCQNFSTREETKIKYMELFQKLNVIDDDLVNAFCPLDAHRIDTLYSNIGEKIVLQENNFQKIHVLLGTSQKGEIISMTTTPSNKKLPFSILASRIFFDFLLMGGQEYYTYCANCGKFIVSQRKGRRKTCSDTCRLALYHKKK